MINRVLTEEEKNELVKAFKAIYETEEKKSLLTTSISDLKKHHAKVLGCKPKAINLAYSEWKKKIESPEDIEDKNTIIESL